METLSYQAIFGDWSATINLKYTLSYNASNNQTTVTFANCTVAYSSAIGHESNSSTAITVQAKDNTNSSKTLTLITKLEGSDAGGGTKTFTATPNPAAITVNHAAGAGAKAVSISAHTNISVVPYNNMSRENVGGDGSASGTSAVAYTLTKKQGSGTSLSVTVYSSPFRSAGAAVSNNGTIYAGETLKVSFSAQTGYQDPKCTVSGVGSVSSGATFSVSGDTTITTSAAKTPYTLSFCVGNGAALVVTRDGSALASGDTIYYGDSLNISFSALTGYEVKSAVLNGVEITSPYTHEVTGSVDINIVTALLSSAWIYVNGAFKRYFINIYIQGAWRRCREKIFSGGGTEQQAICGQALCGTIKCGGDT